MSGSILGAHFGGGALARSAVAAAARQRDRCDRADLPRERRCSSETQSGRAWPGPGPRNCSGTPWLNPGYWCARSSVAGLRARVYCK
eukprot:8341894-Pyramimonas_sp.AAC.1